MSMTLEYITINHNMLRYQMMDGEFLFEENCGDNSFIYEDQSGSERVNSVSVVRNEVSEQRSEEQDSIERSPYYLSPDSGDTWYALSLDEFESIVHDAFNTNTIEANEYIATLTEEDVREITNTSYTAEYNIYMSDMIRFKDQVMEKLHDELAGIWKKALENLEKYACINQRTSRQGGRLSPNQVGKVGVNQLQVRQDLRMKLKNRLLVVTTINEVLNEYEDSTGEKFDTLSRTEAIHTIESLVRAQLEYEMMYVGYLHNHLVRWRIERDKLRNKE